MQNFKTGMTNWLIFNQPRLMFSAILVFAAILISGQVLADYRTQAKRIHDRLAGVVPSNTVLDSMEDFIDPTKPGTAIDAAYLAMQNKHFFNATLVNFITPWTNEARAVFPEDMDSQGILNDYTATVIGIIRDDEDFRKILYDDVLYIGNTSLPQLSTAYSYSSNAHYKELEESGLNLGFVENPNPLVVGATDVLLRVSQASQPGAVLSSADTAGVMTTRAAAKAFFVDGTNRAMFRFTVLNHLCEDMEQLKDNTLPADHIRQDVSRSPGGDSRIFMNTCIGCHTGMDPMTQAFAYYDYSYPMNGNEPDYANGEMVFTNNVVQQKNLINPDNFKPGYIVTDDKWVNYWRQGKNYLLGWNSTDLTGNAGKGSGAKSMGQELAFTNAFARCQVEKVFKAVCLRPAGNTADRAAVDSILANFSSGYKLKQVFAETADYCKGP